MTTTYRVWVDQTTGEVLTSGARMRRQADALQAARRAHALSGAPMEDCPTSVDEVGVQLVELEWSPEVEQKVRAAFPGTGWHAPRPAPRRTRPPRATGKPSRDLCTLRAHLQRLTVSSPREEDRELAALMVAELEEAVALIEAGLDDEHAAAA